MNAYTTLCANTLLPAGSSPRVGPVTTDINSISETYNVGILEVSILNEDDTATPTFPGNGKKLRLGYAFSVNGAAGEELVSIQARSGKYIDLRLPSKPGGRAIVQSDIINIETGFLHIWFSYEGLAEPVVATVRLVY